MLTIYIYQKCSTCRNAIQWLETNRIPFQTKAIRDTPPSIPELENALQHHQGDMRKLFNTSGIDYRALQLKDKLPLMSNSETIQLLNQNGNLVKRPFLITPHTTLLGFKPEVWQKQLQPLTGNPTSEKPEDAETPKPKQR